MILCYFPAASACAGPVRLGAVGHPGLPDAASALPDQGQGPCHRRQPEAVPELCDGARGARLGGADGGGAGEDAQGVRLVHTKYPHLI